MDRPKDMVNQLKTFSIVFNEVEAVNCFQNSGNDPAEKKSVDQVLQKRCVPSRFLDDPASRVSCHLRRRNDLDKKLFQEDCH